MKKIKPSIISVVIVKNTKTNPKYLFIRRISKHMKGTWQYVSGRVEKNETANNAAFRELLEETSLLPSRMYYGDYIEKFYDPKTSTIFFSPVYVAYIDDDQKVKLHLKEHDQYQWVSYEEALRRSVFQNQRDALEHVEKNFIQKKPSDWLRISLRHLRKPILQTERLSLYSFHEDDLVDLMNLYSDPEVVEYMRMEELLIDKLKKSLTESIGYFNNHKMGSYSVCIKDSNTFIGQVGFFPIEVGSRMQLEFKYYLAKAYWNNGFATEASKAILESIKNKKLPHPLISSIKKENIASINLAEKLGAIFLKKEVIQEVEYDLYHYKSFSLTD